MALHFIFYVGEENDSQPRLRGFLDDVNRDIVIYSDCPFAELFRIPSGSSGSGYSGFSGYSGYSGSGISGYSGFSGAGTSGFSGFSGVSGYSGFSGIGKGWIANVLNRLRINGSTTFYTSFFSTALNSTELNVELDAPLAGTLGNFYVRTSSAQPLTGSLVFTVRKNGINTGLAITVPAGAAAGQYSNLINNFTFAQGDFITISIVNNATTPSAYITSVSAQISS